MDGAELVVTGIGAIPSAMDDVEILDVDNADTSLWAMGINVVVGAGEEVVAGVSAIDSTGFEVVLETASGVDVLVSKGKLAAGVVAATGG